MINCFRFLNRLRLASCLAVVLLHCHAACLVAQEEKKPTTPAAPAKSTSAKPESKFTPLEKSTNNDNSNSSPRIVYMPGPDGKLIPVLRNASLDEYLQWLRTRSQQKKLLQPVPDFSVTSIALEGTTEKTRALLTATFTVQLNPENQWVKVPLRLNEAILIKTTYQGVGEAIADDDSNLNDGYHWWFQGKGRHTLTLSLSVPILRQLPTQRLQLSLPPTAVSSLRLTVPEKSIKASLPERSRSTIKTQTKIQPKGSPESSLIDVFGLGPRIDLSWQSESQLSETAIVLQANTSAVVELTGETILIHATQQIQSLTSNFEKAIVRLPAGFELLDIEGKQYQSHRPLPDTPNHIEITLNEPTQGPVNLNWTLEKESENRNSSFILEGFEVEQARRQTGDIAIQLAEGFHITKKDSESRFVHRINASEFIAGSRISQAYRFLKQPFRLGLDVREIEPYFTVEPHFFLEITEEQAQLQGVFRFEVYRGALQEIQLVWPDWKSEGWTFESLEPAGQIEEIELRDQSESPQILIHLVERKSDSFEIPIVVTRKISDNQALNEFTLPTVIAPSLTAATLTIGKSDNLEIDLRPLNGTTLQPLPQLAPQIIPLPESFRNSSVLQYRLNSDRYRLSAEISTHDQEIQTQSKAEVKLQNKQLIVAQTISYSVSYERLAQARVLVPKQLLGSVRFFSEEGSSLTMETTGTKVGSLMQVRVLLAEPLLGSFDLVARYAIDVNKQQNPQTEFSIEFPLIQSSDAEFSDTQIILSTTNDLESKVLGNEWKQRSSLDNSTIWFTESSASNVSIEFQSPSISPSLAYSVTQTYIQSMIDPTGLIVSRAHFAIDSEVNQIRVIIPADIKPIDFWWDENKVPANQVKQIEPGSTEFIVSFNENTQQRSHTFRIDFQSKSKSPFGWYSQHSIAFPSFPKGVSIGPTIWEVSFPFNQHIFSYPNNNTPLFSWKRTGFIWKRAADSQLENIMPGFERLQEELILPGFSQGNRYLFYRFAELEKVQFNSMSRSMIVLVGAGLALALGILLLKIPYTKNILTFLLLGFGVAVTSLWFHESVELLLQPALLGLVLALAATLIDGFFKKNQSATVLTISAPSDYAAAPSSIERMPALGIGSEDPTIQREGPLPSSLDPVSSSELGNRI